jgi:hypothetical protein
MEAEADVPQEKASHLLLHLVFGRTLWVLVRLQTPCSNVMHVYLVDGNIATTEIGLLPAELNTENVWMWQGKELECATSMCQVDAASLLVSMLVSSERRTPS